MFEVRAYDCPRCTTGNGVDADAVSANEMAGAETWGVCWSCGGGFSLTEEQRRAVGVRGMLQAVRSPVASNISFSMWHPIARRGSEPQRQSSVR